MTTKLANWHHYPLPWRFEEEGYNGGPCVKDASGSVVVILFWPLHPPEQTESAEQETYALGKAIAAVPAAQLAEEHVCQTPNYTDGPCYACAKDMLMEWVFERYENCVRISGEKTGEDRAEWLKDADHFMLILIFLRGKAMERLTITE